MAGPAAPLSDASPVQGEVGRSPGRVVEFASFPVYGQQRQVPNPSGAFGASSPYTGEPFSTVENTSTNIQKQYFFLIPKFAGIFCKKGLTKRACFRIINE